MPDVKLEEEDFIVGVAYGAPFMEEEKFDFDVILLDPGPNKIMIIKIIRELTNLPLYEAKKRSNVNSVVATNLCKYDAEDMKKKLETAGAKVELR